jgi:ParB/RepB/Spo0J family partition protein
VLGYYYEVVRERGSMDDKLETLQTALLTDPWVLLRPVLIDSIDFLELKTSLEEKGFLNSISVRPSTREPDRYEIIDGMWRATAAKQLRMEMVPCIIKYGISDDDVLALQIQANAIRPKTRPVEFAKQLRKLQKIHEGITLGRLSSIVNKKPQWVQLQLGLLRLEKLTQKAIDRGEITLANAYMLSKIPPKLRPDYVDLAKTMPCKKFKALAAGVIKQFREATCQGKLDTFYTDEFKAQPYLMSLKEIEEEVETQTEAPLVLVSEGCTTAIEGWMAALQWALHIDKGGREQQENAALARARKTWKGA